MQQTLPQRYLAAKAALFERAFSSLNPRQQEAVFHVNGPLLVLAGAGSGKTTVLVRRVAFLIRYGNAYHSERLPDPLTEERVSQMEAAVSLSPEELFPLLDEFADDPCPPWRVLAITFTNKAANEIKSRLAAMFPQNPDCAAEIWTGTFHSVCVRILRRHGEACGYRPGFSIYDADDSKKAFSEAMKRAGVDEKVLPLKTVANAVSRAKDRLLTPEEYEAEAGRDYRLAQIARVYTAYQQLLRESNALDFDDLIMQTVLLLQREPSVVEEYQRRFRYVCVDEYQDTNPAQFALTRLLSGGSRNIMVVGDDDQSIYRFRGATIENILSFDKAYPGAAVVRLEQNYRSTQNILDAANNVILQNAGRMGKTLWTAAGEGAPIHLIDCDDQNDEGRRIVDVIQRMVARGEASYRDFAVLYRVNAQSQSLEKAFARAAVPYRMLGGLRFNDRKEIRDAAAYLQLIANHNDNMRLLRIINEPRRKIGPRTLEAIALIAQEQDCSMFAVIERAADFVALKNARPMLEDFARLIHTLTDDLERLPLDVFFDAVLDRSGYRRMLAEAGESEADRLDNLEEFKSQIIDYMKNAEEPTLAGFLEETALVADVDRYDESADAVVMMTVHSAKGLEFPVVFLPGMEEGVFPGMQTIEGGQAEMEEERRLCYVAITRAKRELYILHTAQRLLYGRTCYNPISRFVSEIPDALLQKQKRPRPSGSFYGRVAGDWEDSEYTEDDWLGAPSTYLSPAGSRGEKGSYRPTAGHSVYGSRGAAAAPGQPRVYFSESGASHGADVPRSPDSSRSPGSRSSGSYATDARRHSGPAAAKTPPPARERFAPGDRVRHPVFGEGEVLSVRQLGADTLYEVMFDTAGTKKLMASYAKLRRA